MNLHYLSIFAVLLYWRPAQSDFLEKVCMLPKDEGSKCAESKALLQYYFDTDAESCKAFLYKGCDGNQNRFTLQDDCTDACQMDWMHRKKKNGKSGPSLDSDEDDAQWRWTVILPQIGVHAKQSFHNGTTISDQRSVLVFRTVDAKEIGIDTILKLNVKRLVQTNDKSTLL
ncbi:Kunitz-type serine protease inhibitor U1-aranetoxin-Av1a [Orchesella cincta]|uniref:Kunitz-type serine protease inhibitor U1-aranetoxin-Av1a n=1 Tax=Orchesella cincta TaxID=48709 RepID=A0A1D2N569_ORCCI|nr:Kunitz-type serine protease inhibitor U1-aranetoxin-Av1a [Orchesella cincta]